MAVSLRYKRSEAGRRARKARADQDRLARLRRKTRVKRHWERLSRAKRIAQGATPLEVPSLTLPVAPKPLNQYQGGMCISGS